jgi:hypothetical protein
VAGGTNTTPKTRFYSHLIGQKTTSPALLLSLI